MTVIFTRGPVMATRCGEALTAEIAYGKDPRKTAPRTWLPACFDRPLAAWFDGAADGDQVEVSADVDSDGRLIRVRMTCPPAFTRPRPDQARLQAVARYGGGVNPYTFIPALPRHPDALPEGLGDGPPAPHGVIDPASQWSGWLTLRLVTRTPMLLPDPETARRDADDHPTYPVRQGPDGQPLLHGASVKGALRSAYETVTGSRYGVFRGHATALAYRQPAISPKLTPARVESDGNGGLCFRLCAWPPLPVPLYGLPGRRARAMGAARDETCAGESGLPDWRKLHGRQVWYTTRAAGHTGSSRTVVDQVTLATEPQPAGAAGPAWLSITGRSIENKSSERLFVPAAKTPLPVQAHHHRLWHAVLASYRDAAQYHEPGTDQAGRKLERSRHVSTSPDVPTQLADGDLVYLELDSPAAPPGHDRREPRQAAPATVMAIHPVIFGRVPYPQTPAQALDLSLHPAARLEELSPADRLFGWVSAASGQGQGRPASSGYRGRLRVEAVECLTPDWLTPHSPAGVTLAPLSSPKPTQFRFYAAADADGTPVENGARKETGYQSGLRGRKAYWYPSAAPDGYWEPGDAPLDGGRFREWQQYPPEKNSQNSSHLGWVREGTGFTVRLFLDAVPAAELSPLIWLASQDGCALRLGAGKPYGFGAVAVSIDWEGTELRTGQALHGCWLDLNRPAPAPAIDVEALAGAFHEVASSSPVLAPAVTAWLKVARGHAAPIHYPRTQQKPEPETYRWFVANERIADGRTEYGFALPHVLEDDQRLPLLPPTKDSGPSGSTSRNGHTGSVGRNSRTGPARPRSRPNR